ncbi:nodulation protein NodH [Roseivivax isoporae]|uniref:Nodulation protein NodH n=1 Tax=Roseivivax isoporae LMG 25204 TaxID=1449351 RepID=X7F6L6_9RHOB|nr:nodulation protein NodH [Roseivivax isoporae]ETX28517.1 nodulation protein NodH [Roseivivax isoporae LMG 25204]
MTDRFDYFVIFAEMRTGSNFLETNLNAFPALTCHGEAFNPHFIGYPNAQSILGIDQAERDADPERLLRQIARATPGLGGFRYFHDHDPRILQTVLDDPRAAKIILTRNPVDSYVSWKIAQGTGQWKLTNVARRRETRARFDAQEFEQHLAALQDFQVLIQRSLQHGGQTAFHVAYEDLQDVAVMNGIARWLGIPDRLEGLDTSLKRQNPESVEDKVENFAEMEAALVRLDRFNLSRTPNFEPRRGPVVPSYHAGARTPLLYLPIRSGPEAAVLDWMAALDGVGTDALKNAFSQKTLRQWMRENPGHRSFTVVRHPLARAHEAFCARILSTGPGSFAAIRRTLVKQHGLDLPESAPGADYDADRHRRAFEGFLRFLKANLAGQTAIRVDAHWASQSQCLQGHAEFALPDMIVREDEMPAYLPALAMQVGHAAPPDPAPHVVQAPFGLARIYDDTLEALAQEAYARDYIMFGYGAWG